MKVVLTVDQANELLAYLQRKPYVEVARLIDMLQKSVIKDQPQAADVGVA